MSVHQYIGARYVPGFKGTYSATTVYEALDVVDDGLGTSYIAKVPTPAGTPLSDTNYWMVYGSSNGAIINLQNRMTAVENDISNNIKPDIKALQRNIVVIGNSYVARGITDKLEANFKNAYRFTGSGTGFLPYTGHTTIFEDFLDTAIASSLFSNDEITDIIICSAVGDTRAYTEDPSTFQASLNSALASFAAKLAAFTNLQKVTVTLAETRNRSYFTSPANTWAAMFAVHHAFARSLANYGIGYLGWSGFNSLFVAADIDSDNYHPSVSGAQVIGTWINRAYFGKAEYTTKHGSGSGIDFNITTGSTCVATVDVTPDTTTFSLRRISVASGNVIATVGDTLLDTDDLTFPAPPGISLIEMYDSLRNISTGAESSVLFVSINEEATKGTAIVRNRRAITEASFSAMTAQIPILALCSYQNI